METYDGLTTKQWKALYGYQDVVDPTCRIKLRPISDLKHHEIVMACSKAAPVSFMTYEDRVTDKWEAIYNGVNHWTVDCSESNHYFIVTANDDSGFYIYAFNKVAAGTVICNPLIITEWASVIAYLVSIKIDVFNLKRFPALKVKIYTTLDPTVEAIEEKLNKKGKK